MLDVAYQMTGKFWNLAFPIAYIALPKIPAGIVIN